MHYYPKNPPTFFAGVYYTPTQKESIIPALYASYAGDSNTDGVTLNLNTHSKIYLLPINKIAHFY